MNTARKYKAVIIGCGNIGFQLRRYHIPYAITHFDAYAANQDVALQGICDTDEQTVIRFAKEDGIQHASADLHTVLATAEPDIVSICTPDSTHYSILKQVLAFGCIKAIWCEKPIATTLKEGKEMVALCKERNVTLMINFLRRYDPFYQELHSKIKAMVGDIAYVTASYSGGITTCGSHLLDLLLYLFGKCLWVSGRYGSDKGSIEGRLEFEGGVPVYLIPSDSSRVSVLDLCIIGSKGRVDTLNRPFYEYDYRYFPTFRGEVTGSIVMETQQKEIFTKRFARTMFRDALQNLLTSIHRKKNPLCSGNEGLLSLELLSALVHSAGHDGKITQLPFTVDSIQIPKPHGEIARWKH
ncbi:TPA: Gfo/Idh/MocA family oxidoreductase [Candidatus Woesearchaeota archaeon]|nr:Gfo/Idh/MocA family oxidoreductase [Candidatus Woesearchaeota archaeon]